MRTKILTFIAVSFLASFSLYSSALALNTQNSATGLECRHLSGSDGVCRWDSIVIIDYNNYQGHQVDVSVPFANVVQGGGTLEVWSCMSQSGIMWTGSCWKFFDVLWGAPGVYSLGTGTGSIGSDDTSPFGSAGLLVRVVDVNPAVIDITMSGRRVSIDSFSVPPSETQGNSFPVSWSTDWANTNSGRVDLDVTPNSGITCNAVNPVGPSGSTTCQGTQTGTFTLTLQATGPGGIFNTPTTVSDPKSITINPPPGPPPPPPPPSFSLVNLDFFVKDSCTANPILGATVNIDQDFGNGTTRATDGNGFANFGVGQNTSIGWTVSANGYNSSNGNVNVGDSNATVNVNLTRDCEAPPPPPPPPPPPTPTPPEPTPPPPGSCIENHWFESITIPSSIVLTPGQQFDFSVVNKNVGNTWWYHGSFFQFVQLPEANPPIVLNPSYGHLAPSMHSGDTQEEDFTLTAPDTSGTYTLQMRMVHRAGAEYELDDGTVCAPAPSQDVYFGQTLNSAIIVSTPTPLPTPTPPPTASNIIVTEPNYCISGPAATVGWTYSDPSGSPQSAYQVQIDDQGSFQTPEWDTGQVFSSGTSNSTPQGILQFNTTYKARVQVWNGFSVVSGWTESGTWKTPNNAYPQVNFTWAPQTPNAGQTVQFTDQTQFFSGNINNWSWAWLFGDNTSSTLQNPQHAYTQANTYNVTLTATDNTNQSCSITNPVNVQKPNPIWKEVNPGG